ncbi:hypothetical protein TWF730_008586 [Orbilia blumenaviensis]|uniref:Uncharacterized protein n=1 Tax=Orbilia blumenaviensis TaxID=1796055 RepID=A0AAV9V4E7_9PEZI
MSVSQTYVPRHLIYNGPSPYGRGQWVPEPRTPSPLRTSIRRDQDHAGTSSTITGSGVPRRLEPSESKIRRKPAALTPYDMLNLSMNPEPEPEPKKKTKRKKTKKQSQKKTAKKAVSESSASAKPTFSLLSYIPRLLFCCMSTRPPYTKIQHLVVPTSQVCIDTRALRFLQALPRQEFLLLNYIVQEVFTKDGVKVLGKISEYDELIESALTGQIRTVRRPWTTGEREGYVEHTAGLYAKMLRKLGTYEKSPMCEKEYGKKFEARRWSLGRS